MSVRDGMMLFLGSLSSVWQVEQDKASSLSSSSSTKTAPDQQEQHTDDNSDDRIPERDAWFMVFGWNKMVCWVKFSEICIVAEFVCKLGNQLNCMVFVVNRSKSSGPNTQKTCYGRHVKKTVI